MLLNPLTTNPAESKAGSSFQPIPQYKLADSPKAKEIWEHFEKDMDYYMIKNWGDDRFLWHEKFDFKWFPKGEFYSFLYGADYYDPEKRIVDRYRPEYTVCLLNGLDYFPGYDKKYDELSNN